MQTALSRRSCSASQQTNKHKQDRRRDWLQIFPRVIAPAAAPLYRKKEQQNQYLCGNSGCFLASSKGSDQLYGRTGTAVQKQHSSLLGRASLGVEFESCKPKVKRVAVPYRPLLWTASCPFPNLCKYPLTVKGKGADGRMRQDQIPKQTNRNIYHLTLDNFLS